MALTLIENESVIVVNTVVENTTIEVIEEPKQVVVTEPDNIVTLETLAGAQGEIGPRGPQGIQGIQGEAATVDVGTTETVAPDQPAEVTNAGTVNDAILNFKVPQGIQGEVGESGYLVETAGTYPERPPGDGAVTFVGETNPDLLGIMLVGDTWINTATDGSGAPSYLQADTTVPILATNLVNNPRFVKTSGDVLVQESLLGYGGSTPTKNTASAPMVDLDDLGADGFVYLPGIGNNSVDGSGISTGHNDSFSLSEIDVRFKINLSNADTTPGIIEKAVCYRVLATKSGNNTIFRFDTFDENNQITTWTSAPILTGVTRWYRVTYAPDATAGETVLKFFESSDGVNWAQLGGTQTRQLVNVPRTNNGKLNIGLRDSITGRMQGRVYAVQLRDGIDGNLVADFDADDFVDKAGDNATATDSVGNVWTLDGAGTKVHTRKALWLPGTAGNYVSTPDKNELDYDSSTFENGVGKWEGLNKNLLTADKSSFESTTSPVVYFSGEANCSITRTTSHAYHGSASGQMTATAAGNMLARAHTEPVIPGQVYTINARIKAATQPRNARMVAYFYTSTSDFVSAVYLNKFDNNTVSWTQLSGTFQVPLTNVGRVAVAVEVLNAAAGEVHYIDALGLFETPNANLARIPDMEVDTSAWWYGALGATFMPTNEDAYTGTKAAKITTTTPNGALREAQGQSLCVEGTAYTISAYVKAATGFSGSVTPFVEWWTGAGSGFISAPAGTALALDNTWKRVTFTATAPATAKYMNVGFKFSEANSSYYVDAVQVVKGSTAVTYLPPQTTNLITNPSFETDILGWTNYGSNFTRARDTSRSFVGAASQKFTSTGASTFGASAERVTVVPGRAYTFSTYVWSPDQAPFVNYWFQGADGSNVTGTQIVSGWSASASWQRLTTTFVAPAGAVSVEVRIYVNYAAVNQSFWIDAVQLEHGSVATPYVDGGLGAGYSWDSSENLLSAENSSFEGGTTGSWINRTNSSLSVTTEQKESGTYSLKLTSTASSEVSAVHAGTSSLVRVVPGQTLTASGSVRCGTSVQNSRISIAWYQDTTYLSATNGTYSAASTTGWQRRTVTGTAPANATHARVDVYYQNSTVGDVFYVDNVQLERRAFATPYGQTGVAHASTSTRQTPWVLGGTSLDIMTTPNNVNVAAQGAKHLAVGRATPQIDGRPYGVGVYADVNANTTYTISANTQGAPLRFRILDAATGAQLGYSSADIYAGGTLKTSRDSLTFATGSATRIYIRVEWTFPVNYNVGVFSDFYLDAVQLEKSATATAYVPPLRITGDIDIRAKVALEDWTPSQIANVVHCLSTGGYALQVNVDGKLRFAWANKEGTVIVRESTVSTSLLNGSAKYIRSTLDADNGAAGHTVTFYTSDDGISWTALGAPVVTAGVTTISENITFPIRVGCNDSYFALKGKALFAQVRAGIDGPVAAEFNAEEADAPGTSWTDTGGRAWTINRSGDATAEMVDRNTFVFTGTQYLNFPDRSELEGMSDGVWAASIMSRQATNGRILTKRDGGSLNFYSLQRTSFEYSDSSVSTVGFIQKPVGTRYTLAGELSSSTMKSYINGVLETSATVAKAPITNTQPLIVGTWLTATSQGLYGSADWFAVIRRTLTTTEHAELGAWNGLVPTEPVWLRDAATLYVNADDALTRQLYRDYNYVLNLADGFTGDTADSGTFTYAWTGTPYQSTARQFAPEVVVRDNSPGGAIYSAYDEELNRNVAVVKAATNYSYMGIDVNEAVQPGDDVTLLLHVKSDKNFIRLVDRSVSYGSPGYANTLSLTPNEWTWVKVKRKLLGSGAKYFDLGYESTQIEDYSEFRVANVFMIKGSDYFGPYFDGDSAGVEWAGTAHDSVSRKIFVAPEDLFQNLLPARANNSLLLPDDTQTSGWKFSNTLYLEGTGFPEGVVTAPVGSRYIDTAATNGAVEWVKTSGTGNTGWKVAVGDTGWRWIATTHASYPGQFKVRRVGDLVFINASTNDVDAVAGITNSDVVATVPAGFTATKNALTRFPWSPSNTENSAMGWGTIASFNQLRIHGALEMDTNETLNNVQFHFEYHTEDSWPTILPGTPA